MVDTKITLLRKLQAQGRQLVDTKPSTLDDSLHTNPDLLPIRDFPKECKSKA